MQILPGQLQYPLPTVQGHGPILPRKNPDIEGLGVVIGFLATSWVTLLCLTLHYISIRYNAEDSSKHQPDLIDRSIRQTIQRTLKWTPSSRWRQPLETLVLCMSDQQLVTGLAILISSYTQIPNDLSLYHWEIITSLAWFSSATHIASLPYLTLYFKRKPGLWYCRVFLMSGLAIMLAIGLIPSARVIPDAETKARPVISGPRCAFFISCAVGQVAQIVISEFLIVGGLVARLLQMSATAQHFTRAVSKFTEDLWINSLGWTCRRLDRARKSVQVICLPWVMLLMTIFVFGRCLVDFLSSTFSGLLWLLFSLMWGTVRKSS